jgi:hypothetical protein
VLFDFVSFSLNPQVHATDTRTLVENLQAQTDAVSLAHSFARGREVFVSPVTFKIRDASDIGMAPPADSDGRLFTAFGAMWTMLSIGRLAGAGSITFYQANGYRGILQASGKYPLYQVFVQLKTFGPKWVIIDKSKPNVLRVENESGEEMVFSFGNLPANVFV